MWARSVLELLRLERLNLGSCRPTERRWEGSPVFLRQEVPLLLQRLITRQYSSVLQARLPGWRDMRQGLFLLDLHAIWGDAANAEGRLLVRVETRFP